MAEESLIPKKSPTETVLRTEGFGAFLRLAVIVFFVAALFTLGLYAYRGTLNAGLANQKSVLNKLQVEFEPSLIDQLARTSDAIAAGRQILRNHVINSAIFDMIESNTLPAVSFDTFSFSLDKNTITLTGIASSYADVSAQSSVFESLPNVQSATFGNLSLKDTGNVGFALNIILKK